MVVCVCFFDGGRVVVCFSEVVVHLGCFFPVVVVHLVFFF